MATGTRGKQQEEQMALIAATLQELSGRQEQQSQCQEQLARQQQEQYGEMVQQFQERLGQLAQNLQQSWDHSAAWARGCWPWREKCRQCRKRRDLR